MTVERFLNIVCYSTECPSDIDAGRWRGMLKWYTTRKAEGEL